MQVGIGAYEGNASHPFDIQVHQMLFRQFEIAHSQVFLSSLSPKK